MSTISGVSPTDLYSSYQAANQSGSSQLLQNLNALGTALQSGNPATAQSALSTLQTTLSNNTQGSTNQPFGNNSAANADYTNLTAAVKSGNTSDAQTALAKLAADLKGGKSHGGHRHHGGGAPAPAPAASTDTTDSTSTSTSSSTTGTSGSIVNVTV